MYRTRYLVAKLNTKSICLINAINIPHDLNKFLFFLTILCIHGRNFLLGVSYRI